MSLTDGALLNLRNISKRFDGRTVLRNFSAAGKRGERILIAGANGSGKTTLLRIIAGLSIPDEGVRAFNGNGKVSWLPTGDMGFWPRLTALEGLRLYARLWGVSDDTLNEQLESWRALPAFAESLNVPVLELSTGRRQLLHLSRVLLSCPDLILMDEPFRSLDSDNSRFVEAQFARWARSSLVIWSSPILAHPSDGEFAGTTWNLSR